MRTELEPKWNLCDTVFKITVKTVTERNDEKFNISIFFNLLQFRTKKRNRINNLLDFILEA